MCGIIGYIGELDAVPPVLGGLRKLEYRGYDSAGIAVCGASGFTVVKRKGRLDALDAAIKENPVSGHAAVGHTRWATHGEPSDGNSHPHVSQSGMVAVVHNGIIENYRKLRERLITRWGVEFHSETDTEVIAQLAGHYYDGDILATVAKVMSRLEGSYALGIMCCDEPDKIIAAKKDNPLIIGVSLHGHFIASDVPAILEHTNTVYYMEDGEIAVLTKGGVEFYSAELEPIRKTLETVVWSAEDAEKGGYEHFMFKEIAEQPRVIRDTIESALTAGHNRDTLAALAAGAYDKVAFVACGTACNAGVVAKYVFERVCPMQADAVFASEFRYGEPFVNGRTLVVLISQSGETADTIAALREAKRRGARTLAIVNVVGSTIAKEADAALYTIAGPEIAVASTKAFSAQLALLYCLAVRMGEQRGRLAAREAYRLRGEIRALPELAKRTLDEAQDCIQQAAARFYNCKSIFFVGRGVDYAVALEGSLKLKEISYIHSEAYAGGELKHGPIALIEDNTLVVAISCSERLAAKTASNVEQVLSRGASVLMVTNGGAAEDGAVTEVRLPETEELFAPSLAVLALQLFSYYVACNKGLDIDKPRNLAKSVTVE